MNDQASLTRFPPGTLVKFNQMGLREWGSHFENDLFIVLSCNKSGLEYDSRFNSLFNARLNRIFLYILSYELQSV